MLNSPLHISSDCHIFVHTIFGCLGSWDCFPIQYIPLLGPFYGALAAPSVTRCRCCRCCGHRCACGVQQLVATPGEWQCKIRRRAAARSGEWAQHFSNASCSWELRFRRLYRFVIITITVLPHFKTLMANRTSESQPSACCSYDRKFQKLPLARKVFGNRDADVTRLTICCYSFSVVDSHSC